LRERYGDNPSTHLDLDPDLWMEVGSFGGPDKNQVYGPGNNQPPPPPPPALPLF